VKYIFTSKAFKSYEFKPLASKFSHIFTQEKWITFSGQVDLFSRTVGSFRPKYTVFPGIAELVNKVSPVTDPQRPVQGEKAKGLAD
jgi:hypothetical protein